MNTNTVPVLYRHKETERFESAECAYVGPIARKVWVSVNKQFLKLNAGNYFFPCEPADAYHAAIREVERVAGEVGGGGEGGGGQRKILLTQASVETYLMNVGYKALYHFHCRVVAPLREEYRRTERKVLHEEESEAELTNKNSAEGADVGGEVFAAACEAGRPEPPQPMTAQQLVESLPGEPNATTRRNEARALLAEICAKLPLEAVIAFRSYIAADGNMYEAAHLAHQSKTDFYRKWPGYLAMARKVMS